MKYSFCSHFAEHIKALIEFKQAMGYPYEGSTDILGAFDRFCIKYYPETKSLTKELIFRWGQIKETENNASFRNRIMPVRELAKYLNAIGIEAYIAPTLGNSRTRMIPYIFSHEELSKIFAVIDKTKYKHAYCLQHLMYPVIFRMIYCCGLRPVEARRLKITDVNLETGRLFIEESKGHKDRIVMMSDDLLELCRIYHKRLKALLPNAVYFFHSQKNDGIYSKTWLAEKFREVRKITGITGNGSTPRPYDLRHTFATHKLYEWMKAGEDLNVCLPYLSAYMGHENYSDTAYYIHLVPDSLVEALGEKYTKLESLLPEVEYEG
jgi:integrase